MIILAYVQILFTTWKINVSIYIESLLKHIHCRAISSDTHVKLLDFTKKGTTSCTNKLDYFIILNIDNDYSKQVADQSKIRISITTTSTFYVCTNFNLHQRNWLIFILLSLMYRIFNIYLYIDLCTYKWFYTLGSNFYFTSKIQL